MADLLDMIYAAAAQPRGVGEIGAAEAPGLFTSGMELAEKVRRRRRAAQNIEELLGPGAKLPRELEGLGRLTVEELGEIAPMFRASAAGELGLLNLLERHRAATATESYRTQALEALNLAKEETRKQRDVAQMDTRINELTTELKNLEIPRAERTTKEAELKALQTKRSGYRYEPSKIGEILEALTGIFSLGEAVPAAAAPTPVIPRPSTGISSVRAKLEAARKKK